LTAPNVILKLQGERNELRREEIRGEGGEREREER
jgi:hypothetical protein